MVAVGPQTGLTFMEALVIRALEQTPAEPTSK